MKDIHIVIVNFRMKEKIEACLSSLMPEIKKSALDISLVVVDNHSEDGIADFLTQRYPEVGCIELEENLGFAKAQNRGLAVQTSRYYFSLNPDTEFLQKEESLQKMFTFMEEHPHVGMLGPKILNPDGTLQYSCWRFPHLMQPIYNRTFLGRTKKGRERKDVHHMKDFDHNKTQPVDAIMGSAMFVRGTAMQEVGMFDERFWMYFEDIDWCIRMWERGWPVYYVHDIVITHLHGRGSAKGKGIIRSLFANRLLRIHIASWVKFMWKWRHSMKFYATR